MEMNGDEEGVEDKLRRLEDLLEEARGARVTELAGGDMEAVDVSRVKCNIDKRYYLDAVSRIRRYIYDGEVYQVNFSQRFECEFGARAIDLYHWQNRFNASPYAAYVDAGDFQIVSASPEMFVTIKDGVISTKPIKGTRPRAAGGSKALNDANFRELVSSEKEQAELNMIIDLERNDLGRICEYGTIKVVQPRTIEEYPTVFHAVATVEGKLREEITFCDMMRAMFPGGSITGAPKIASMKIIDELEPTQRGVYTGSMGFIGIDGTVCLNIAIRTIIISNRVAYAQTGGGIVADSAPDSEWHETITKARALLAGIQAVQYYE
jgi:para-aminobenzoate synthetase component 1